MRRIVALLAALVLLTSCGARSWDAGRDAERSSDRGENDRDAVDWVSVTTADLESLAHIELPSGAHVYSTQYTGFLDWYLTARIGIPASTLAEFLGASKFPEPTPGLRAVRNADRPVGGDWDPDAALQISGVDQTGDPVDGVFRSVLIDLGQPDVAILYLVAFTT